MMMMMMTVMMHSRGDLSSRGVCFLYNVVELESTPLVVLHFQNSTAEIKVDSLLFCFILDLLCSASLPVMD